MRRIHTLALAVSSVAMAAGFATPVLAQSTGTLDFQNEIVVTATGASKGISGVVVPDSTKATAELNQKWIAHEVPGQSVNDILNYLPGVSFQNNDAYGSSGGTLTIRGFDNTRISETFDGVTLNDDGNYALYASELLDTEVIDSVRVNLGTTDIDSPTASASGSTVNFVSHMPSDSFHYRLQASGGTNAFYRAFGMIDTGVLNSSGTKLWLSASKTGNSSPFNNYTHIKKEEYNGKIYQPLGANGFLWIAGFYFTDRNNFQGSDPLTSVPLKADNGTGFTYYPTSYAGAYYNYPGCTVTNSSSNTCGTAFDYRPNPVNLGNMRAAIKLPLSDKLTWTMDPSYQFTKANGGGTSSALEGSCVVVAGACTTATNANGLTGYINGKYYLGRNVLSDGFAGTIPIYVPSETVTHRVALTTSLIYTISEKQSARISYAMSDSAIRQTGEASFLNPNGSPPDVFATDNPLVDGNGNILEKRAYHSIAALNQISGEYKGKFWDDRLSIDAGLRIPFLTRNLNSLCYTRNSGGSLSCVFGSAQQTAYSAAFPTYATPQTRSYHYNAVLPSIGLTYKVTDHVEGFANYSKGMQAPNAIALYQSYYFPLGHAGTSVQAEKADNMDLGMRYNSSRLQAQVDLWYTHLINKLDTAAYNPVDQTSIYANLGPVDRYGIDANLEYKVSDHLSVYVFGSTLKSKIKDNIDAGPCTAAYTGSGLLGCTGGATEAYYQTAGKFEGGIAKYTLGGRIEGSYGIFTGGIEAKRTGGRYVNAQNTPFYSLGNGAFATDGKVVYGAEAPAYTLVNLDLKIALEKAGLPARSFFQLNVTNLFNQFYVGGFGQIYANTQSGGGSPNLSNVQVGAPRAVLGTLAVAF